MKKAKAIELLKLAVPIKALTQQEYADFVEAVNMGMDALEQPEPQEGHWENDKHDMPRCSQCGYIPEYNRFIDDYYYSDYCPNCGARMKGADT